MTHHTDAERQDFEAWCDKNEYDRVERLDGSGYNNEKTKRAWLAWQAGRRAQVAPSSENATVNVWQQAVDHELVNAHLGVAGDVTAEEAAKALHDLICWNIEVATDPLTNGGKVLVPADAIATNKPSRKTNPMTRTNTEDAEAMRLVSKRRKDMAAWAVKNFRAWPKPHEMPDADPAEIGCELVVLNQHQLPVLRCKLGGGYVDSTAWFYHGLCKRNPQK